MSFNNEVYYFIEHSLIYNNSHLDINYLRIEKIHQLSEKNQINRLTINTINN